MRASLKRRLFYPALVVLLLFSFLPLASAQTDSGLNLTTSPLPINLATAPGSTVTADLRVQNSGTTTERLKIDLYKFRAYGESGKPQIIDREPGDDYFDWVSFSAPTFTAEPNVWKTIKMTIKVPSSAAFGYYYAVVFSRADQQTTSEDRSTAVVGGSATLVLLEASVPGAKRKVEVASFSADRKFYEFLPASFNIRLSNGGQVHVAPSGTIFLMRGGKQVGTLNVNRDKGNILPGSARIFNASWTDGFPVYQPKEENGKAVLDDKGQSVEELRWDFGKISKLKIGRYTAKLVMVYDDGTRDIPIEGTLSFWVVPWKLLLVLLLIIILAGVGLWATSRNLWRRARRPKVSK